jgi:carbonic anhydrase/acetyltransferase-like protein (isoleucine patch superfamily)
MLYEFQQRRPTVGRESYVSETALIVGDVRIGNSCYIGHGAILRGDLGAIEIGPGTAVEEGVIIHVIPQQVCRVGERVTIGHGAIIHAASIGDRALIGMGAVLSIDSVIGTNAIVAEGSVVRMGQTIPEGVVAGGNPAVVIRKITAQEKEYWDMGADLYIDLAKQYLGPGLKKML